MRKGLFSHKADRCGCRKERDPGRQRDADMPNGLTALCQCLLNVDQLTCFPLAESSLKCQFRTSIDTERECYHQARKPKREPWASARVLTATRTGGVEVISNRASQRPRSFQGILPRNIGEAEQQPLTAIAVY